MQRRLWLAIFLPVMLYGQAGTGTISGSVQDSSGAVVPGATITAVNENTGFKRESVVGSAGEYSLTGLVPGEYAVAVEMQGFKGSPSKM